MRRTSSGLLACAATLSMALGTAPARADLLTTVTPTVVEVSGPIYSYSYLVANSVSSTVGVAEFDLAVRSGVLINSIVAPTGFTTLYNAGDPDISFLSSDPTTDIKAGSSAVFSFTANAAPGSNSEITRGFDATGVVFQNPGTTLTPTALPEPSVFLLSALGGLAVLGHSAYRRIRNRIV